MNRFETFKLCEKVDFGEVFSMMMFYTDKEYKNEFEKFNYNFKHLNNVIKRYKKLNWYKTEVELIDLMNINMVPVGWLRRFACIFRTCIHFNRDECITCRNESMQNFTLNQCVDNFYINNKFSNKIISIINRIMPNENGHINDYFVFCTVVRNKQNKLVVIDGNSRLLSLGLLSKEYNLLKHKVKIYIGESKFYEIKKRYGLC